MEHCQPSKGQTSVPVLVGIEHCQATVEALAEVLQDT